MANKKVVVTGFGPFHEHKINASWEAVKILPEIFNIEGIELVIEEVPVTYTDVERKVKYLWENHRPVLVIHVGVSGFVDEITIETVANRTGYIKPDCQGSNHPTGECCSLGDDMIVCSIDAGKICEALSNNKTNTVGVCVSDDAGRYLCEYIFYKSLNVNRHRTMFIHVPPLGEPYTARELATGLKNIITEALKQIQDCCM